MDDLNLYAKNEKVLYSLVQTVRVFSNDIGMQFGLDKCVVLIMKRGKIVKSGGIESPNDEEIRSLKQKDSYKYPVVLHSTKHSGKK